MEFTGTSRRDFVKASGAALAAGAMSWSASSYAAIIGANDRVRVGIVGCGDRMKQALIPSFLQHSKELNFEFVAVSDIWNKRREEGAAYVQKLSGNSVDAVRNNDELYARKDADAVKVLPDEDRHRVDVTIDGQAFTSYIWPNSFPLGRSIFDPTQPAFNFSLEKGQDATFRYRIELFSKEASVEELNEEGRSFASQ